MLDRAMFYAQHQHSLSAENGKAGAVSECTGNWQLDRLQSGQIWL